jgi:phosphoribosylamine--glycine ligase
VNVLLIGSGGREHALAWKIAQSPVLETLYIAPGNPGTASLGTNVPIAVENIEALAAFSLEHEIELVVVGPEVPLVLGIYDYFQQEAFQHIHVLGPSKAAAALEGSKDFAKQFMQRHQIPTAAYQTFDKHNLEAGFAFLESLKPPYVLKADGLAAGKGVIITNSLQEAKETLQEMIASLKFGEASSKVVVEEFLKGIELSVFALTDGKSYILLPEAKDYKRIGEKDTGLNTGGMGAVSPVPFADDVFMRKVIQTVVEPTIAGISKDNLQYRGFVFFGLINVDGDPFVIEYNCRMGDPETEVVMPRIVSDVLPLFAEAANGNLRSKSIEIDPNFAVTTMLVAGGYPEDYQKGDVISQVDATDDVLVFHAGTQLNKENQLVTNGGRVMALTGKGKNLQEAQTKSQAAAQIIQWKGKYFRTDIGFDLQ